MQVVPLLVDTADGQRLTLRGGYFPIKHDPRQTRRPNSTPTLKTRSR